MLLGGGFIGVVVDETLLLFFVRVKPNVTIGTEGMQSFDKGWRAWGKKILGVDEACIGGIVGVLDRMNEPMVV